MVLGFTSLVYLHPSQCCILDSNFTVKHCLQTSMHVCRVVYVLFTQNSVCYVEIRSLRCTQKTQNKEIPSSVYEIPLNCVNEAPSTTPLEHSNRQAVEEVRNAVRSTRGEEDKVETETEIGRG